MMHYLSKIQSCLTQESIQQLIFMKTFQDLVAASKDDPAALLRIYRNGQPTEYLVGKAVAELNPDSSKRLGKNGRR